MDNQKLRSKIEEVVIPYVKDQLNNRGDGVNVDTLILELLSLLEEETARQREEIHAEVKKLHKASQGIRMQYRDGQAVDLLIGLFALERRLDNLTQKDKEELKPNE